MTGRHRAVECDVIPAKVWEAVGTFRSNYIWSMHIDNGTLVDACPLGKGRRAKRKRRRTLFAERGKAMRKPRRIFLIEEEDTPKRKMRTLITEKGK